MTSRSKSMEKKVKCCLQASLALSLLISFAAALSVIAEPLSESSKTMLAQNNSSAQESSDSDMPGMRMRKRIMMMNGSSGGASGSGRQWRPPAPGFDGGPDFGDGAPGSFPGGPPAASPPFGGPGGFNGAAAQDSMPGGPGDSMQFRRARGQRGMGASFQGRGPADFGQAAGFSAARRHGSHSLDLTPLGLSDEQKDKIKAMREQSRDKIKDLRKNFMERQNEMRSLMFNPEASESQIRAAHLQVRKLQNQMDETNMNDLLAIRSMLSPEQRKRLPDCMPGRGAAGANGEARPMPPSGGSGFRPGPAAFDGAPADLSSGPGFEKGNFKSARNQRRSFQADNGAAK
ncbi:MAG: Spy/CpxP family protein refolding chaperone [Candidatus Obscuribacterales bacterium]|nr:Spy/CpxP family protein refolding chaperone [Candidatus Obscuribacterales bacterium]